MEWTASLRLKFPAEDISPELAAILAKLPGILYDDHGELWKGMVGVSEFRPFAALCHLADGWDEFHAEIRGKPVVWDRYQFALRCGCIRLEKEVEGAHEAWCQSTPEIQASEPIETYPTPCNMLSLKKARKYSWLSEFGNPAGGFGWQVDRDRIRYRMIYLVEKLRAYACPWFPLAYESDLNAWLGRLPEIIEAGPDSPYKIVDGDLELRFPDS